MKMLRERSAIVNAILTFPTTLLTPSQTYYISYLGGTVESTTSLANFEPPDHARIHLAQDLSHTK